MKTLLRTQLKQTSLKNRFLISTESPKVFKNTLFQHFVDELKHCNPDIQMDLILQVPVCLCLYSICLAVM